MAGGGMGGGMMPPSMAGGSNETGFLGGPTSSGGMSPMPPTGGFQMNPDPSPQPFSGMGTSQQTGTFGAPPLPPQPPNGVSNQVPPVSAADAQMRQAKAGLQASQPKPPMPMMGQPMPAQSTSAVQRNRMTVHNPTGLGTTQASMMAQAQKGVPANQPSKKVGMMPPTPSTAPGAPK